MSNPRSPLQIGILVFDDFEPIDVWGFIEAFSIARYPGGGYKPPTEYPFHISFLTLEQSAKGKLQPTAVRAYNAPRVLPDLFADQALARKFDVFMVPGGYGINRITDDAAKMQSALDFLHKMDGQATLMTSVCTGAALLAASGLLNGKPATSNHGALSWVAQFGPLVLWDNVARWVDAGKYVTSAGVSAGTDMGFYLVQRLLGRGVAENAVTTAEYNWLRDPQSPIFYPQQAKL